RLFSNLLLLSQHPVFSSQALEFLLLVGGQTIGPLALIDGGLGGPLADRDRRGFELFGQALRRAAGSHQVHHPSAEFRRVRGSRLWHRGLLLAPKGLGVHETGSGPEFGLSKLHNTGVAGGPERPNLRRFSAGTWIAKGHAHVANLPTALPVATPARDL